MSNGFDFDDIGQIVKFILVLVVVIPFLGAMFSLIGSLNHPNCPSCDCSPYQTSLSQCQETVNNLTQQIRNTSIEYIQNITYVEVPYEKIIYRERFIPVALNILALIFSVTITIKLITIKLPEEIKEKLKKIEKAIIFAKIGSLIVSIIIFIRLIFVLFSF